MRRIILQPPRGASANKKKRTWLSSKYYQKLELFMLRGHLALLRPFDTASEHIGKPHLQAQTHTHTHRFIQICFIMLHLDTLSDGSIRAPFHSDLLHNASSASTRTLSDGSIRANPPAATRREREQKKKTHMVFFKILSKA